MQQSIFLPASPYRRTVKNHKLKWRGVTSSETQIRSQSLSLLPFLPAYFFLNEKYLKKEWIRIPKIGTILPEHWPGLSEFAWRHRKATNLFTVALLIIFLPV